MSEFSLGEMVLVRNWPRGEDWTPAFYVCPDQKALERGEEAHIVFGGERFRYCIPLKGNEALIGLKPSKAGGSGQ